MVDGVEVETISQEVGARVVEANTRVAVVSAGQEALTITSV